MDARLGRPTISYAELDRGLVRWRARKDPMTIVETWGAEGAEGEDDQERRPASRIEISFDDLTVSREADLSVFEQENEITVVRDIDLALLR